MSSKNALFEPREWISAFFKTKEFWEEHNGVWTDDFLEVQLIEENGCLFLEAWNIEISRFLFLKIPVYNDFQKLRLLVFSLEEITE